MIVVSDSSPFIALATIGHLDCLPLLYGRVAIPDQVLRELQGSSRSQIVRSFFDVIPPWLEVHEIQEVISHPDLQAGESAAISLALKLGAALILMDEAVGRAVASAAGLAITGTLGVLFNAAQRDLIDLADAFAKLKRTDFWVQARLYDEQLAKFRVWQSTRSGLSPTADPPA